MFPFCNAKIKYDGSISKVDILFIDFSKSSLNLQFIDFPSQTSSLFESYPTNMFSFTNEAEYKY